MARRSALASSRLSFFRSSAPPPPSATAGAPEGPEGSLRWSGVAEGRCVDTSDNSTPTDKFLPDGEYLTTISAAGSTPTSPVVCTSACLPTPPSAAPNPEASSSGGVTVGCPASCDAPMSASQLLVSWPLRGASACQCLPGFPWRAKHAIIRLHVIACGRLRPGKKRGRGDAARGGGGGLGRWRVSKGLGCRFEDFGFRV